LAEVVCIRVLLGNLMLVRAAGARVTAVQTGCPQL